MKVQSKGQNLPIIGSSCIYISQKHSYLVNDLIKLSIPNLVSLPHMI